MLKFPNISVIATVAIASIVFSTVVGSVSASEPDAGKTVSRLKDLVGAKAGQAENAIKQRGYKFVKGADGYTYWLEPKTNYCVTIHTVQGRYDSIVYAGGDLDCKP
jgi:hypothetical protein